MPSIHRRRRTLPHNSLLRSDKRPSKPKAVSDAVADGREPLTIDGRPRFVLGRSLPAPTDAGWVGVIGQPTAADPTEEYVSAGGMSLALSNLAQILSRDIDEITRRHGGERVYVDMMRDAAVNSSVHTLKYGTLSDPIQVIPSRIRRPSKPDAFSDSDIEESKYVADMDRRALERLDRPIDDVVFELMDGLVFGSELAEQVWEEAGPGEDEGFATLSRINVKGRDAWSYVVDPHMNVVGYLVRSPLGTNLILSPEKFLVFRWRQRSNDPRGISVLEPAFLPWNIKVQVWPELMNYLVRFGSPLLIGEVQPNAGSKPSLDAAGNPVPGARPITPEQRLSQELSTIFLKRALAVPNGSKVTPVEVKGNGEVHRMGMDLCNREIVLAILTAIRATMESQHNSRADSQTAFNVVSTVFKSLKRHVGRMISWQVFYGLNAWNLGVERANRDTPRVICGDVRPENLAEMMKSAAAVGYAVAPSHLPQMDVMFGLELRDADEIPDQVAPPAPAPAGKTAGAGVDDGQSAA